MADIFTKAKRSEVMSRIRGRGNKNTELALMAFFRRNHIAGWRRGQPVYGKPDFVFRKHSLAVFVDGCFWHGCPIHGTYPNHNARFWKKKLEANVLRDQSVSRKLRGSGWYVIRIWEHELARKNDHILLRRLRRLRDGVHIKS